jgi:tRNA(Ile)-lysidine synthase
LQAGPDRLPHLVFGKAEIRRYRDDLYLMSLLSLHDASQKIPWDGCASLEIPGIGILLPVVNEPCLNMTVRFRQGGEICQLPGRQKHHRLKKIFQERGIPPWQRDRIPLIFVGEKLVRIGFDLLHSTS